MSDLSAATVGSKIKIPDEYSRAFTVVKVYRVTDSQVFCGTTRLRKSDGLLIGTSGFSRRFARIATEADILAFRMRVAQSRVAGIRVTEDNLVLVESLIVTAK